MACKNVQITVPRKQFETFMAYLGEALSSAKLNAFMAQRMGGVSPEAEAELVRVMTFHDSMPTQRQVNESTDETMIVQSSEDESCLCEHCQVAMRIIRGTISEAELKEKMEAANASAETI